MPYGLINAKLAKAMRAGQPDEYTPAHTEKGTNEPPPTPTEGSGTEIQQLIQMHNVKMKKGKHGGVWYARFKLGDNWEGKVRCSIISKRLEVGSGYNDFDNNH